MIHALFRHLDKDCEIVEVLPQKPTARCPFSAIVMIGGYKKYVVIAKTDAQKFYLKRSIEKQREFYDDFSPYFQFNFPDEFGNLDDFTYAIYPYIENAKWCCDNRPIEIMEKIYKKHAKTHKMSPGLLAKIQTDFLSSWPEQYHAQIKQLPLYKEYFDNIAKQTSIKIYREHCDYTVNNILDDGKNLWLMDFEFSKNFQPVGHDLHDYSRTVMNQYQTKQKLAKMKEILMDNINDIVDDCCKIKQTKKKHKWGKMMHKIMKIFHRSKKFAYPKIWNIKPTDKICILAPHPDDETIGCGGLLALYAKQCDVICLTDGRYGDPDIAPPKMTQIRKKELESVMKKFGVNKFAMLNLEDSHLRENKAQFQKLNLRDYDYIVIPSPRDFHPDHMAVAQMLKKSMYADAYIVFYEIWNTLANQTHYVDISSVVAQKRNMINMYKSQVKHIDYASRIIALNHYRGICHNVEYEEAYEFQK
ncbi:MAG: PIG-L family deacetylase [Alphaproteobacteria bacterium]|nr:PIG-L family deacetylase [Alphaproteobacteria bacterium]